MIGCTFAALSGVLVLPFIGLNAIALTFLVVQAFGAAAIGAFAASRSRSWAAVRHRRRRQPLAEVRGRPRRTWLSGLPNSLPFIVLFVVLLLLPRRKLVPPSSVEQRPQLQ